MLEFDTHEATGLQPPNFETLDTVTGVVLRICPLDTWWEKEGGGRWLGGQCEGWSCASSMCCFVPDYLSPLAGDGNHAVYR
jgi:hypothetical protein